MRETLTQRKGEIMNWNQLMAKMDELGLGDNGLECSICGEIAVYTEQELHGCEHAEYFDCDDKEFRLPEKIAGWGQIGNDDHGVFFVNHQEEIYKMTNNQKYPEQIYETPDGWGGETYYYGVNDIEGVVDSLKVLDGWENTSIEECEIYDLIEVTDGIGVYKSGEVVMRIKKIVNDEIEYKFLGWVE
jgi:hypothetical protein